MKVAYTHHARLQALERSISHDEITHVLRNGHVTRGQANKTLLTDRFRNIRVVAVSQTKTRWLVITAYRIAPQNFVLN